MPFITLTVPIIFNTSQKYFINLYTYVSVYMYYEYQLTIHFNISWDNPY